jgi:hypothetical protein
MRKSEIDEAIEKSMDEVALGKDPEIAGTIWKKIFGGCSARFKRRTNNRRYYSTHMTKLRASQSHR